jgi:hypothetical protein
MFDRPQPIAITITSQNDHPSQRSPNMRADPLPRSLPAKVTRARLLLGTAADAAFEQELAAAVLDRALEEVHLTRAPELPVEEAVAVRGRAGALVVAVLLDVHVEARAEAGARAAHAALAEVGGASLGGPDALRELVDLELTGVARELAARLEVADVTLEQARRWRSQPGTKIPLHSWMQLPPTHWGKSLHSCSQRFPGPTVVLTVELSVVMLDVVVGAPACARPGRAGSRTGRPRGARAAFPTAGLVAVFSEDDVSRRIQRGRRSGPERAVTPKASSYVEGIPSRTSYAHKAEA